MGMKIFQVYRTPLFWDFLHGYLKTMKFRDLQEAFDGRNFAFIGQFFCQNDVFKLQQVYSELFGSEYSLRTYLEISRYLLFYRLETNRR
jgi:hypothetical protein